MPVSGGLCMAKELQALLTPNESVVALIDYQPQMLLAAASHKRQAVLDNALTLAKAARLFEVPVILTTVAAKAFSGEFVKEIQAIFPEQEPIDRTTMNSWEDKRFRAAVTEFGRKKIIIA